MAREISWVKVEGVRRAGRVGGCEGIGEAILQRFRYREEGWFGIRIKIMCLGRQVGISNQKASCQFLDWETRLLEEQ